MTNSPMPNVSHNCSSCSCCGGNSQRASLGRILLGVIILSAMFFWGLKFGLGAMDARGGRGGKGGYMMGKSMYGGCAIIPTTSGAQNNTDVEEVQPIPAPEENLPLIVDGTGIVQ